MNIKINRFAVIALSLLMLISCSSLSSTNEEDNSPKTPILIDSKATEATQTLYTNLYNSAKNGVIIGQQEAYINSSDKSYQANCDISDITDELPLLTGGDIENLTNDDYNESNWRYKRVENYKEWIKECHKKGVFVTISWHFREPFYGEHFYVTDMDANDPNTSKAAFKSILEGGVNHSYYKKKLTFLADFFKALKDENGELIPIIFRPWHEFGGSWFWWGVPYYATSREFIQNWRFMVDYLRNDCGVHNLIYAITPGFETESEYMESYPGDEYVDILGFDSYTGKNFSSETTAERNLIISQLNIISDIATNRNKVAAFTEFGHDLSDSSKSVDDVYTKFYLDILNSMNADIAYMMFWYNSDKHFTPLADDKEYIDDFKSFIRSDKIITSGEIISPLLKQ